MILLDVDPNLVKPGWTPLFITLLLAAAMVFLYFSMRKQFRKIRIPDEGEEGEEYDAAEANSAADVSEESASEPPPSSSG